MDLLLLAYFSYRVYTLAQKNNLNPFKWVVINILNWIMGAMLGTAFITTVLNIRITMESFSTEPLTVILVSLFSMGCGYLGYMLTLEMMKRKIV
ncbi:MAG: hypothetical protein NZ529_10675 [Cytophagaceae bacterium]|nr:hypothetical protein [Cytophagaceae bacterium]MDW8457251.1 hypothetical protein [Cytophagaceae bacterium]